MVCCRELPVVGAVPKSGGRPPILAAGDLAVPGEKEDATKIITRSPPATTLDLKMSADVLRVFRDDLASKRGRIIRLCAGWTRFAHIYAVFYYILRPTGNN